jgi:hypothetical protein
MGAALRNDDVCTVKTVEHTTTQEHTRKLKLTHYRSQMTEPEDRRLLWRNRQQEKKKKTDDERP